MAEKVRLFLRDVVGRLIPMVDKDQIGDADLFTALGMDSVQATDLSAIVADAYGLSLPPTLAFDYPTLDQLANHIAATLARKETAASGDAAVEAGPHLGVRPTVVTSFARRDLVR